MLVWPPVPSYLAAMTVPTPLSRRRWSIPALAAAALAFLAAGVTLPLLTISRLWVFEDDVSILAAIHALWDNGETFLAAALLLFSIVFPAAKLAGVMGLWAFARPGGGLMARGLGVLDGLGRWSMMDVLVAALLIFSLKASGLASATSQPGLYCFAAAVVLSMSAGGALRRSHTSAIPPS